MRMLVLGAGLQGTACTYDLLKNPSVSQVVLADVRVGALPAFLTPFVGPRLEAIALDVTVGYDSEDAVTSVMRDKPAAAFQAERSRLVAPASGVILDRFIEDGQIVGPGTPIAAHRSPAPVPTRPSAPMTMARGRAGPIAASSAPRSSSSAALPGYLWTGPAISPRCCAAQHFSATAAPAYPAQ